MDRIFTAPAPTECQVRQACCCVQEHRLASLPWGSARVEDSIDIAVTILMLTGRNAGPEAVLPNVARVLGYSEQILFHIRTYYIPICSLHTNGRFW